MPVQIDVARPDQGPVSVVASAAAVPTQAGPKQHFSEHASHPGKVLVPEINTAIVTRGDNLWRISHRTYGDGLRYTVIYGGTRDQIRDPSLIYPGQSFVLPPDKG